MHSIWSEHTALPHFAPLHEDLQTHVLIIGGGMAGLLCARTLHQRGVDCALVEANTICSGVTQNTTAKITAQHGLIYDKLTRTMGQARAAMYLAANEQAVETYRALCRAIACDFVEQDAYVYSIENREKLEREMTALDALHAQAAFVEQPALPFPVAGAIRFARQAHFHPLKFASAVAKDLPIYENTAVTELGKGWAKAGGHTIHAAHIIVATHFPISNKHGGYFLKLYQHRSYVLALEHAQILDGMYVDEAQNGLSFRNYRNLLLLGGGDHRTGKRGGNWRELRDCAARFYPDATELGHWATQDCMSLDSAPYIGPYGKRTNGLWVATGFSKWGTTGSMVAANVLADLVTGASNPYAPAFDPARSVWHPQLFANGGATAFNLLTPTAPRCPHLGCALKWNRDEHSWDCPCHGSRFTRSGKLLNNPATGNMSSKQNHNKTS